MVVKKTSAISPRPDGDIIVLSIPFVIYAFDVHKMLTKNSAKFHLSQETDVNISSPTLYAFPYIPIEIKGGKMVVTEKSETKIAIFPAYYSKERANADLDRSVSLTEFGLEVQGETVIRFSQAHDAIKKINLKPSGKIIKFVIADAKNSIEGHIIVLPKTVILSVTSYTKKKGAKFPAFNTLFKSVITLLVRAAHLDAGIDLIDGLEISIDDAGRKISVKENAFSEAVQMDSVTTTQPDYTVYTFSHSAVQFGDFLPIPTENETPTDVAEVQATAAEPMDAVDADKVDYKTPDLVITRTKVVMESFPLASIPFTTLATSVSPKLTTIQPAQVEEQPLEFVLPSMSQPVVAPPPVDTFPLTYRDIAEILKNLGQ